jgi:uncharacterized membrane protein
MSSPPLTKPSHPVHPATVHLPIAFMLTASALDLATWFGMRSPSLLTPLMKLTTNSTSSNHLDTIALINYLSLFSYASTVTALFTSLPTLSSGLAEGYAMIQANGLDMSNPKVKVMAIHALLNDVAVAGAFYNYWTRSKAEGFLPSGVNVLISSVMLGGVIYSAYLGGSLVYKHGVGVQRQGDGKVIKEKMMNEKKEGKKEGKKEL